jgi:hypothetical protein
LGRLVPPDVQAAAAAAAARVVAVNMDVAFSTRGVAIP